MAGVYISYERGTRTSRAVSGARVPETPIHGISVMASLLEGNRVGVAVQSFSATEIEAGVKRLEALTKEKETSDRCVRIANEHFQLAEGVRRYARVDQELLGEIATSKEP